MQFSGKRCLCKEEGVGTISYAHDPERGPDILSEFKGEARIIAGAQTSWSRPGAGLFAQGAC